MPCTASASDCRCRSTASPSVAGGAGSTSAIPTCRVALEAKGFEYHGQRARFDDDALRGNELLLAGYRVLTFTQRFTDLQIAEQVAEALGDPPRRRRAISFEEWKGLR